MRADLMRRLHSRAGGEGSVQTCRPESEKKAVFAGISMTIKATGCCAFASYMNVKHVKSPCSLLGSVALAARYHFAAHGYLHFYFMTADARRTDLLARRHRLLLVDDLATTRGNRACFKGRLVGRYCRFCNTAAFNAVVLAWRCRVDIILMSTAAISDS